MGKMKMHRSMRRDANGNVMSNHRFIRQMSRQASSYPSRLLRHLLRPFMPGGSVVPALAA